MARPFARAQCVRRHHVHRCKLGFHLWRALPAVSIPKKKSTILQRQRQPGTAIHPHGFNATWEVLASAALSRNQVVMREEALWRTPVVSHRVTRTSHMEYVSTQLGNRREVSLTQSFRRCRPVLLLPTKHRFLHGVPVIFTLPINRGAIQHLNVWVS